MAFRHQQTVPCRNGLIRLIPGSLQLVGVADLAASGPDYCAARFPGLQGRSVPGIRILPRAR
jgi:hypothetical protein